MTSNRMARDGREPVSALPDGTYIALAARVRLNKGGRTGAMLMRARMLSELGGRRSLVATYDDYPDYAEVRRTLFEQGKLHDPADFVNLFEFYRDRAPADLGTGSKRLPRVPGTTTRDEPGPDGAPARRHHVDAAGSIVVTDHLRPDGSVFMRAPLEDGTTPFTLVDHRERVVRTWRHRRSMVRTWLTDLVPTGEVFVVTDSRYTGSLLMRLRSSRFRVLEVVHNPHTTPDYRWDRPVLETFRRVFDHIDRLDGLVLLTDRHRQDVAWRFGPTNNLFTVPNPVIPVESPGLAERDRAEFVVLARLERQKRVGHALRAFAVARRSVPEARLSVYGDGRQREHLEGLARQLDVSDHVTFYGYDPRAREKLRSATALMVTSSHEGFPLGTLEAMSSGCPVLGYDVKYGMREQITDGVTGFLVDEGDFHRLAARMVEMANDPALVEKMGVAARHRADEHSPEQIFPRWVDVLARVHEQAGSRTKLVGSKLVRASLGRSRLPWSSGLPFQATVSLLGKGPRPGPQSVSASLDLIVDETAEVVSTPLKVARRSGALRLSGHVPASALAPVADAAGSARLVVVWQNTSREFHLASGRLAELKR
ncbi:glycosyltransferase [Mumia zhuanghuii]|uniref:Glycosyltransferase n=2 Tax=Mumia TaxID=1546255 RepID=A0A5Q6S1Y3_9ACTN|nr:MULTISPECIES: glycosyltransferase [Mumia]KAA1418053.1 glycosyltransferase [Mumia zhuanghuii]KAA1424392.1 glycosyltransferase [Mumia zhuanghuii]